MEMASNVGPNGRILAFEHNTFSFGLLQSRMKCAGIVNIEAYQLALGDKTRRAVLYCCAYNRVNNRFSKYKSRTERGGERGSSFYPGRVHIVTRSARARRVEIDVQGAAE